MGGGSKTGGEHPQGARASSDRSACADSTHPSEVLSRKPAAASAHATGGPDPRTLAVYARTAGAKAGRYESVGSPFLSLFTRVLRLPPGARILDVGCGSGRDLAALAGAGYRVAGVEPVAELRVEAERRHPRLACCIHPGHLPGSLPHFDAPFDAVLCSAVLQHLPAAHHP
ncbi:MAG: class I SAM-dependent methyltransferase, partial [Deltaproteobacteria bacterium]